MPAQDKPKSKYGGGARKGAGRPVSSATLKTQQMRKIMVDELHKRFKPLMRAQLDAAMGVTTEHYDAKKGDYYYKEHEPNNQAFKTILEQVHGRATEKVEMSGKDGVPLIIKLDT